MVTCFECFLLICLAFDIKCVNVDESVIGKNENACVDLVSFFNLSVFPDKLPSCWTEETTVHVSETKFQSTESERLFFITRTTEEVMKKKYPAQESAGCYGWLKKTTHLKNLRLLVSTVKTHTENWLLLKPELQFQTDQPSVSACSSGYMFTTEESPGCWNFWQDMRCFVCCHLKQDVDCRFPWGNESQDVSWSLVFLNLCHLALMKAESGSHIAL